MRRYIYSFHYIAMLRIGCAIKGDAAMLPLARNYTTSLQNIVHVVWWCQRQKLRTSLKIVATTI